jgi:hypothetical protein
MTDVGTVVEPTTEVALAVPASANPLARLEDAVRLLAEASDLDEIMQIRDLAEAARLYAKAIDRGLEAQNHAAEIKIRAERRAGEILASMAKNRGATVNGRTVQPSDTTAPRLVDLGISRSQASRWQAAAVVPEMQFVQHVERTRAEGRELTSASVLAIAKPIMQATRRPPQEPAAVPAGPGSSIHYVVADVRVGLRALPDHSMQTGVSSPPYYKLRSYKTAPQVWGGTRTCDCMLVRIGDEIHPPLLIGENTCSHCLGCRHAWSPVPPRWKPSDVSSAGAWSSDVGQRGRKKAERTDEAVDQGALCSCGAWLGELGQEPHPDLYVAHVVEAMRGVKRVLRKDGCFWLNIGDSSAGSGKGPTGWNGQGNQTRRQGFSGVGAKHERGRDDGEVPTQVSQRAPDGIRPKSLMGVPERLFLALLADGWIVRRRIPWVAYARQPESVADRPSGSIEYVLLLTLSREVYWNADAVRQPVSGNAHSRNGLTPKPGARSNGVADTAADQRNLRTADFFFQTWQGLVLDEDGEPIALVINPAPSLGDHYAGFPPKLVEPMLLASSRPGDPTFDPFAGLGTVGLVAARLGRDCTLIELNESYAEQGRDVILADGQTQNVELTRA